LSEAPWSRNSCHNACSAWASAKWAGGVMARSRSRSARATVSSEAGTTAHDDEASAPSAGRPDITQPRAPPPGARGLVRTGSSIGPIWAAGYHRPGPPPPPPDCRRLGSAPAKSTAR
jgi:hypothetical protein